MSFLLINHRTANGAKQTKSTGAKETTQYLRFGASLGFSLKCRDIKLSIVRLSSDRLGVEPPSFSAALESWVINAGFRLGFVRAIL